MTDILKEIAAVSARITQADKLSAQRLRLVSQARAAGCTWDEIEIHAGLSRQSLSRALTQAGLPNKGNGRFGRQSD